MIPFRRRLRLEPLEHRTVPASFVAPRVLAEGASAGNAPRVVLRDATTGQMLIDVLAYNAAFTGGVNVAVGDITGDGIPDLITAAGAGGGPHVRVLDGRNGSEIRSFYAYDSAFTGGVFLASADLDHDGYDDIITGAGAGGGPHVRVFGGKTGELQREFYAYDPSFGGGVRVAVGDLNDDGQIDIVTAAGPGGGPHVKAFDGKTGATLASFYAYDANFRGGVSVAVGDVDADRRADIITGAGPGGGPHVKAFDVAGHTLASLYVGKPEGRDGVFVSVTESPDGLRADLVVLTVVDRQQQLVGVSTQDWKTTVDLGSGADLQSVAGSWVAIKDPVGSKLVPHLGESYMDVAGAPPLATSLAWFDWYDQLLAQREADVPLQRGHTLYFSQEGSDTGGDGSYENPYRSMAKAQQLINAFGAGRADLRLRFRRGDVWRETAGLYIGASAVTVDDYGDQRLPKPVFSRFTQQYLGGWQLVSGTVYRRAESEPTGTFRLTDDPFGRILFEARDGSATATVPDSWAWDNGYLYVNLGSDNPNTARFEGAPRNLYSGVDLRATDTRLENVRVEGWGVDPDAAWFGIEVGMRVGQEAVVKGCEAFYTGYHAIGQISDIEGGIATFIDCDAGLCSLRSGATVYVGYANNGGQECIFENCDSEQVLLPTFRWLGDQPAASQPGGQTVYGHTSGGTSALMIARGCDAKTVKYAPYLATYFENSPLATTLAEVRTFIVDDTSIQPDTIYLANLAPNNTVQINCHYLGGTIFAAPGYSFGIFQGGWAYNCVFEAIATYAPVNMFAYPYGYTTALGGAIENCEFVYHGLVSMDNGGAFFNLNLDAAYWGPKLFRNNIFSVDVVNPPAGAVSLNVSNTAGNLRNNAYWQVANPANVAAIPGQGAGVIQDPGMVLLTATPGVLTAPSAQLVGAGELSPLEYDILRRPRGTSRVIGPMVR